jgi:hypothetical protein
MDTQPEIAQWTAARLAVVAPEWTPDVGAARARLSGSARPSAGRVWRYGLAAAAVALAVTALAPAGRALAQDLWYRVLVTRVDVLRVDLSRVPLDSGISIVGPTLELGSIDAAAAAAGYTPHLPPADVLPGEPILTVIRQVEIRQTIRRAALVAALDSAGAGDVEVPQAWDGVSLRVVVGPSIVARYPGARPSADVEIVQTPPLRLEMPAGFPVAQFTEAAFRAAGLPWWEARRLAEEYAADPAWLMAAPEGSQVDVEKVFVAGREALVVEHIDDDTGAPRTAVVLSLPTRLYIVLAPTRDESLRIVATLP